MKLVNIEQSRVVSLSFLKMTKGAPFSLDLLNAVIARYNFQHYPDRVPAPGAADSPRLQTGNFDGIQIDELSVHTDGLIAAARASTNVIEQFLEDLYSFVAQEFGAERATPETRHYECSVIVEIDERVSRKFDFLSGLYNDLAGFRAQYGLDNSEYVFGGLRVESDAIQTSATAPRFVFERRLRVPFSTNQWFSAAPLRTDDHLQVIQNLETQLLR